MLEKIFEFTDLTEGENNNKGEMKKKEMKDKQGILAALRSKFGYLYKSLFGADVKVVEDKWKGIVDNAIEDHITCLCKNEEENEKCDLAHETDDMKRLQSGKDFLDKQALQKEYGN